MTDISPETVERVAEAIFKAFNEYGFVDGLTWRAFEAEARAAIDAMQPSTDLYVPGVWRCAKCEFELIQSNLNANDGTVTARDTPGDKCPNCNTTLWRVSWKAWATDLGKRLDETWDELQALKKSSNDELPPCPICGAAPIEDTMLRAEPYLTCPTVFTEAGKHDVPCPMHAEGYEAWSTLCRSAQAPKMLTAADRENIVDEIESIICETHELDVRDVDYAENIVSWLERHHPDALRARVGDV